MPVVSGLKTGHSYRCDGSDNSGGLRPAELIALASVSVSRMSTMSSSTEDQTQETNMLNKLATITEKFLGVAPDRGNHSMTLLPLSGTKWYEKKEEEGQIKYDPIDKPEEPDNSKHIEIKYCEKDSEGIQVYPIESISVGGVLTSRDQVVQSKYESKVAEWQDDPNNSGKTLSDGESKQLMKAAENETTAVGVRFIKIGADYAPPIESVFSVTEELVIDDKFWTPAELDNFGMLSVLNTAWSS